MNLRYDTEGKANELVDNYWLMDKINPSLSKEQAKQCALVAVDEILNHHYQSQGLYRIDRYFWEQVKKEIQSI